VTTAPVCPGGEPGVADTTVESGGTAAAVARPVSSPQPATRRRGRDRGGATVLLLAVGLVLVVAGLGGAAVGSARVARHQARVAADFAALAGAPYALAAAGVACRRAADVAIANGARLLTCRVDGFDLLVTVEVTVTPLPGLRRTVSGQARAGPVRA
jgi:secretion/DNA translocation related TadE-like protein